MFSVVWHNNTTLPCAVSQSCDSSFNTTLEIRSHPWQTANSPPISAIYTLPYSARLKTPPSLPATPDPDFKERNEGLATDLLSFCTLRISELQDCWWRNPLCDPYKCPVPVDFLHGKLVGGDRKIDPSWSIRTLFKALDSRWLERFQRCWVRVPHCRIYRRRFADSECLIGWAEN